MTCAEANGAYVANVTLVVTDTAGKVVLTAEAVGPWVFAKLPPGDYRVVAGRAGGAKTAAAFTLTGQGQTVVRLSWN